jgi:hypothetical protein
VREREWSTGGWGEEKRRDGMRMERGGPGGGAWVAIRQAGKEKETGGTQPASNTTGSTNTLPRRA